jgi:hypothetical protein
MVQPTGLSPKDIGISTGIFEELFVYPHVASDLAFSKDVVVLCKFYQFVTLSVTVRRRPYGNILSRQP